MSMKQFLQSYKTLKYSIDFKKENLMRFYIWKKKKRKKEKKAKKEPYLKDLVN